MSTIIERLYRGDLSPEERCRPAQEEFQKIQQRNYRDYEDFKKELDAIEPSLCWRFKQIIDEQYDTMPYELTQNFIDGFCLGAGVMMEVFYNLQEKG